jgi:hypothetical protein
MGRFRRVSLLVGFIFFPALLFAQFNNNTTSPYSRFGLGDLQPYSFGRTTGMGGASLASRNGQQINLSNPASYTSVDSLAFLFEFGLKGKFAKYKYKNDNASMEANDVNFNYFALNFQFTNWLATSMGLTPYSDVGYNVEVTQNIENTGDVFFNYYGEGSLSQAFFGMALKPVKNVSVGANLNYLFGKLYRNAEVYFLESSDFYNLQKYESIRLHNFSFDYGVQATLPLKEDESVTFAAIIENKPTYKASYSDLTQKNISSANNSDLDTLNFQSQDEYSIQFPLSYGFGVSYIKENSLEVNFDYFHQSWGKTEFFGSANSSLPNLGENLTNLNKFALGAEWIPDRFSIRSYLSRIAYRAGVKFEKSYLEIKNQQLNDFGISFGVGLPIYRSNSTINISAEIGKRGTQKNDLILENYAQLNLSVNLYDIWFRQRRYE